MELMLIPDEIVLSQIYYIRGQKVMLDRELAKLYQVQTKVLKQSVKRNIARFPEDFMFEMSKEEFQVWRSQIVTSKSDQQGLRYAPFCFTEQAVAMLSSILRQTLFDNTELRLEIEKIKTKLDNQGKNMEIVFQHLDELLEKKDQPKSRKRIGYKSDDL